MAAAVLTGVLLAGTAGGDISMSYVQAEEELETVYSFDFELRSGCQYSTY